MATPEDAKARAAATYNAAADYYDNPLNGWDRFGRRTIERLHLPSGARVLDACCGSGSATIAAAETVGSAGFVLGIDLAASLLELARTKARDRGLRHIEFRECDILELGLTESQFDAVVCVFGIFFVPDMGAAVRELLRVLRPGGQLAITTWGPQLFEPAASAFWKAIRNLRPDLCKSFNPWDRIAEPDSVRALLHESGAAQVDVIAEAGTHPIPTPDAWWTVVLGSGYRGTFEQLDAEDRQRVRLANLDFIHDSGVDSVKANVIYATATKPSA
jgi:ubiquinone/menaquinone biosynthesis C-methylase UbiE